MSQTYPGDERGVRMTNAVTRRNYCRPGLQRHNIASAKAHQPKHKAEGVFALIMISPSHGLHDRVAQIL